jgi:hypothetical protein
MLSKKEPREVDALQKYYSVSLPKHPVEEDDSKLIEAANQQRNSKDNPLDISMMVLGGFIAAAGIIAVALTFTVFNVGLMSTAGLAVSVVGAILIPIGLGLFAKRAIHYGQTLTGFSVAHL